MNAEDTKQTFDIVIVGRSISSSAVLVPYYEELRISDYRLYAEGLLHGGNAAMQAMIAARIGLKVALVTRYCKDALSEMCRNTLRFSGVNVEYGVYCKNQGISDGNALSCRCGYKQLDDKYLAPEDIIQAEGIIGTAKVVIVHYEIGFMATMETLRICKYTVSILYASPLPNLNATCLFELPTFILFDGKRDLEMHYGNMMLKHLSGSETAVSAQSNDIKGWIYDNDELVKEDNFNAIANLVRYSLRCGAKNAIVLCNSIYTVYGGDGYPNIDGSQNERDYTVKWLSHTIPADTERGNNSAACECFVSLAVALIKNCCTPESSVSLEEIINHCSKIVQTLSLSNTKKSMLGCMLEVKILKFIDENSEPPYTHVNIS